jgi:hypothetical protein
MKQRSLWKLGQNIHAGIFLVSSWKFQDKNRWAVSAESVHHRRAPQLLDTVP